MAICSVRRVTRVATTLLDVAVCSADDKEFVLDVHCVDSVLVVGCCDWILRPEVLGFDLPVPAACDEIWIVLNCCELAASEELFVS